MKALGREHMGLDQVEDWLQGDGSMADLVGQRRQGQVHPLGLEARALTVHRDVLPELVQDDRRQQLQADEAAWRGMERRRRLADIAAIAATELLAHRLDQPEAARDVLQRFGHVLAALTAAIHRDRCRPWKGKCYMAHVSAKGVTRAAPTPRAGQIALKR